MPLELLRGTKTIAIKESIDIVPWAAVVYGCDAAWWRHRRGLPNYNGLKICYDKNGLSAEFPDIVRISIVGPRHDDLVLGPVGTIGAGGNSGFQALNLAVQFGAKRIVLVGFDMNDGDARVHWYGRNRWPMAGNPGHSNFRRWRDAFGSALPRLRMLGVEVINCSPMTALKTFPIMPLEDALCIVS